MKDRPSFPAAEAVKYLFGRMDEKGGRLLPVERAQAPVARAAAREADGFGDDLDDVRPFPYLPKRAFGDPPPQIDPWPLSSRKKIPGDGVARDAFPAARRSARQETPDDLVDRLPVRAPGHLRHQLLHDFAQVRHRLPGDGRD